MIDDDATSPYKQKTDMVSADDRLRNTWRGFLVSMATIPRPRWNHSVVYAIPRSKQSISYYYHKYNPFNPAFPQCPYKLTTLDHLNPTLINPQPSETQVCPSSRHVPSIATKMHLEVQTQSLPSGRAHCGKARTRRDGKVTVGRRGALKGPVTVGRRGAVTAMRPAAMTAWVLALGLICASVAMVVAQALPDLDDKLLAMSNRIETLETKVQALEKKSAEWASQRGGGMLPLSDSNTIPAGVDDHVKGKLSEL